MTQEKDVASQEPLDPEDAEALALFARLPDQAVREELVVRFRPLAIFLARRFQGRGEADEDLTQVAMIGLLKSIDRFDVEREVRFSTYASATIVGELKRHLRDTAWALRVPRRIQELGLEVGRAADELSQRLGRSPTVAEVAAHTKLSEDDVLEGLDAANAYRTASLDASADDERGGVPEPGAEEETYQLLERWHSVEHALRELPARERRILYLRFFRNMTQTQIAEELGISQMHVSRLLSRTLALLRAATSPASPDRA